MLDVSIVCGFFFISSAVFLFCLMFYVKTLITANISSEETAAEKNHAITKQMNCRTDAYRHTDKFAGDRDLLNIICRHSAVYFVL